MIDALTAADAAAAAGLSAGFGWPHRREDWELFLQAGHGFAWRQDGALLGTALWFPLGPAHASIGGVQVAPQLQGQGIGRRLMAAVLDDAVPRSLMLHATAEGKALYERLGFRSAGLVQQWQGICHPSPAGGARLAVSSDRATISALDAAIRVARDDVLDIWMQGATVAVCGQAGYAVRRSFGRGELIGPVVAYDEATALTLLQFLAVPGFLRVDIPADAPLLAGWLAAAGLAHVGDALPMTRGEWPVPVRSRVWAPATQAMG